MKQKGKLTKMASQIGAKYFEKLTGAVNLGALR